MPIGATQWSEGRWHTRHIFHEQAGAAIDLKGAPGDVASFRVLHDKIQILRFGLFAAAAFPNSSTMTTVPIVALDRQDAATPAARTEITNPGSLVVPLVPNTRLSPAYSQLINVAAEVDLDLGQLENPIIGPPTYPVALKGDLLVVELLTAGVGGTQSARFFIEYREVEPPV